MSFFTGKTRSDNFSIASNNFLPLVVATGSDSTDFLAYSTDGGATFTKTGGLFGGASNMQGIATNGTIWVSVGNKGTGAASAYSYDGKNWVSFILDSTNDPTQFSGISWNGKVFVTGSQTPTKLHYSYDGITWYVCPLTPFDTQAITYVWVTVNTHSYVTNGFWLCGGLGTQSLLYSFDGITWNGLGTNSPFSTAGNCYSLGTDGTGLVVAGGSGNSQTLSYATFTPTNGIFDATTIVSGSWTGLGASSPFGNTGDGNVNAIAYNGKVWLAGGSHSSTGQNLAYSYDGKNWFGFGSASPFGTNVNSSVNGICWSGTYWVIVGKDQTTATITIAYASDPLGTWTTSLLFSSNAFGVAVGSKIVPNRNDGVFGLGTTVGIQFQKGAQNTMNFISGGNQVATLGEKGFKKISIDEQYNTFIKTPVTLAAGFSTSSSNFYYSFDGITFTINTSNPFSAGSAREVAYNGKIWTAAGDGGNTLAYSNDGISWTGNGSAIFTSSGRGMVWIGTLFIAGGAGTNTLAYSYNGTTWVGLGTSIFSTTCYSFAWNGTILVGLGSGTNTLAYSYDGINWTGNGTSIFSTQGYSAVWNGTIFVATGSGTNTLAWSKDGITWTGLGTSIFSTTGESVAWSGTYFVAGGSGTNTLAYSINGTSWTGLGTTIITSATHGVTWNGIRFVATGQVSSGNNRIAYTTEANPTSTGNWTSIGSFFSGGGNGGERVIGGYWKWSGEMLNPAIDLRTQGLSSAGMMGINNGLAIVGNQKTLMTVNDQSIVISSPTTFSGTSNAILAAGSGAIDFSRGTGSFKTTTGAVTLGGNASTITVGSGTTPSTNIAVSSGTTGAIDFSNASGAFKTTTGAVTLGGNASTITVGSGTTPSTNIAVSSGTTGVIDFSNSSGAFKTSTGAITLGGNASTITVGSGTTPSTNIAVSSGTTGAIDFSNTSGAFKTTTGAVTIGPGAVGITGIPTFSVGLFSTVWALRLTTNTSSAVTGDGTAFNVFSGTNGSVITTEYSYANSSTFSSGIFTAARTGTYWIQAGVHINGMTSSHTNGYIEFVYGGGSPTTYAVDANNPFNGMAVGSGQIVYQSTRIINLSATNTLKCQITVTNGTKVINVIISGTVFSIIQIA